MTRTILVVLILTVVTVALAAFSADDARIRQATAKVDRAPIDRIVAVIEDAVEALAPEAWATTECQTVHMDLNADWKRIGSDAEARLLGRTLRERGYTVTDVVKLHRAKTCDCAKPPKDGEGGAHTGCAAYCFDGPLITVCWD